MKAYTCDSLHFEQVLSSEGSFGCFWQFEQKLNNEELSPVSL